MKIGIKNRETGERTNETIRKYDRPKKKWTVYDYMTGQEMLPNEQQPTSETDDQPERNGMIIPVHPR
jgi:hypothetical protein